jgi:hypothetical protein
VKVSESAHEHAFNSQIKSEEDDIPFLDPVFFAFKP